MSPITVANAGRQVLSPALFDGSGCGTVALGSIVPGDAVHFLENYDNDGVPAFNFDRAETLASISHMKKIVEVFKATLVIRHDARDIGKLPAFPAAAK